MQHNSAHLSIATTEGIPDWLTAFCRTYQSLTVDSQFEEFALLYHHDVVFIDPMHHIEGLINLTHYFRELYQNLTFCRFDIQHTFHQEQQAAVYWTMTYQHPKLGGGQPIKVSGHSHIKMQNGKIIYHRDYVDLGQMLYQHIPILGRVISWLKARVKV